MIVMGWWSEWKPVVVMVGVDLVFAAMNTMIKTVIDAGLDRLLLVTLRQLVATLFMAPIAYFYERKTRPKLTTEIFVYLFFSALLGASVTQYLFFLGMQYTSATFACAFLNMAPVITFLIALPFGSETLNLKSKGGISKVVGTLVCVTGAMLMTFYRGPALTNTSNDSIARPLSVREAPPHAENGTQRWMVGSIALLAGSFCWSSWFLLQSKSGKKYPALYSGTALVFFLSFIQAGTMSLVVQRGVSLWALRSKMVVITVLYAGVAGSGLGFLAMSWCVEKRGPLFTSAFSPPIQMMVAGIDFSILHEQLHLGSVLGSILVIAGLYFLLWGKSVEAKNSLVKPAEVREDSHVQLQPV